MAIFNRMDAEMAILTPDLTATPKEISVASASAAATDLKLGVHRCQSTTACRVLQGASGGTTALTTSHAFGADQEFWITVTEAGVDDGLAAIRESADGKLTVTALS